ncbi:MAG: hypothetical protein JKY01_09075, partial [Pseudomonadales bacterium]|nr:hypothetical protein [Pseudomonadales bacterium]
MMQKTFFAEDMRKALRLVRDDMGAEAIILANKKVPGGVEVAAAIISDAPSTIKPVKASSKAAPESTQVIVNNVSSGMKRSTQYAEPKAQRVVKEEQRLKA